MEQLPADSAVPLTPPLPTMLDQSQEKLRTVLARRDNGFRWRGHEVTRVEGLSDAVFAFAITLLVVSLEVPKTFAQLRATMQGFIGFALCFLMLLFIWHAQYLYFRRYALDDRVSFLLNALLLFVVAFYIYPLKFLFTLLVHRMMGMPMLDGGVPVPHLTRQESSELMIIYSAGFVALYAIFALLYAHAYRLRDALGLDAVETHETYGVTRQHIAMMLIGVLSLLLAWAERPALSGMIYFLISPVMGVLGYVHGRRRKTLIAERERLAAAA
jgi:uncharacterized membrane protein